MLDRAREAQQERGLSFERITVAIEAGYLLQILSHQNPMKYPRQKVTIVALEGYAYLVPFVEEEDYFYLVGPAKFRLAPHAARRTPVAGDVHLG